LADYSIITHGAFANFNLSRDRMKMLALEFSARDLTAVNRDAIITNIQIWDGYLGYIGYIP